MAELDRVERPVALVRDGRAAPEGGKPISAERRRDGCSVLRDHEQAVRARLVAKDDRPASATEAGGPAGPGGAHPPPLGGNGGERRSVDRNARDDGDAPAGSLEVVFRIPDGRDDAVVGPPEAVRRDAAAPRKGVGPEEDRTGRAKGADVLAGVVRFAYVPRVRTDRSVHDGGAPDGHVDGAAAGPVVLLCRVEPVRQSDMHRFARIAVAAGRIGVHAAAVGTGGALGRGAGKQIALPARVEDAARADMQRTGVDPEPVGFVREQVGEEVEPPGAPDVVRPVPRLRVREEAGVDRHRARHDEVREGALAGEDRVERYGAVVAVVLRPGGDLVRRGLVPFAVGVGESAVEEDVLVRARRVAERPVRVGGGEAGVRRDPGVLRGVEREVRDRERRGAVRRGDAVEARRERERDGRRRLDRIDERKNLDVHVGRAGGDCRGAGRRPEGAPLDGRPAEHERHRQRQRIVGGAGDAEHAGDEPVLVAVPDLRDREVARVERLRAGAVQHVAAGRHRLDRVGERRVRRQAGQRGGVGLRERRIGARHFKFRAVDAARHRRRVVVGDDDRDRERAVRVADDRRRRHRRRAGVDEPDLAADRGERAALLPPLRRDPRGGGRAVAQAHLVHLAVEAATLLGIGTGPVLVLRRAADADVRVLQRDGLLEVYDGREDAVRVDVRHRCVAVGRVFPDDVHLLPGVARRIAELFADRVRRRRDGRRAGEDAHVFGLVGVRRLPMEGEAPGGALVALAAADDVAPLQIAEILLLRAGPQPEGGVEVGTEPVGGVLLRAARRGDNDAGRVVVVLRDATRAAELAARDGERARVAGRGDAVQVVGRRVEDLHRAVARFVQVPDAGVAAPHAVDLVHGGVRSVVDADRRAFGDGRHLHPEAGLAVRVPVLELDRKRAVFGVRDEDVRAVLAEVGVVEAQDAGAQADEQREVRERRVRESGGDGDRERLGEVRRCDGVYPRRERGEDGDEG